MYLLFTQIFNNLVLINMEKQEKPDFKDIKKDLAILQDCISFVKHSSLLSIDCKIKGKQICIVSESPDDMKSNCNVSFYFTKSQNFFDFLKKFQLAKAGFILS